MPHIDHAALWVTDLDGARDFYSHWFNGHSNGLYENPGPGCAPTSSTSPTTRGRSGAPAWSS